jgi:hypothetical protein
MNGGLPQTGDHLQLLIIIALIAIPLAIYAHRKMKRDRHDDDKGDRG